MQLKPDELIHYNEKGYLLLPSLLSVEEVTDLKMELVKLFQMETMKILEKDEKTVRSIHAPHYNSATYDLLQCHPKLLEPAMQILGGEVYVHQYKINLKAALEGDVWKWHRDYIFWEMEDGIPTSRLINAVVFLDEVNEFNGPMILIPGSHETGATDPALNKMDKDNMEPEWKTHLSADLKYTLDQSTIRSLAGLHGMVAPKGPAGSVLFFHPEVAHASAPNLSPYDRNIAIITYNSIENTPPTKSKRPDFLANHNYTPLKIRQMA